MNTDAPVYIDGAWRESEGKQTFRAFNAATGQVLDGTYPISSWSDIDRALESSAKAAVQLRELPAETIARFLEDYATSIEASADDLVRIASLETALPISPRLLTVELPRTTGQLRQAAAAARERSWAMPTIDTKVNIRSLLAALGPIVTIGPNNFPFAYNGISGGDFAAAIASGNPVIAKAHPLHPGTSRLLAQIATKALAASGLPAGTLQFIYHLEKEDGLKLVADQRIGATGFTGSRTAGLALKAAADAAGKPIYLEMSSLNPVVILPGALRERSAKIAEELTSSCLTAAGQFCTKPGLVLAIASPQIEAFVADLAARFNSTSRAPLLGADVARQLEQSVSSLINAGAQLTIGGAQDGKTQNTLLRVTGRQFIEHPSALQLEAFGNATMIVLADEPGELVAIVALLQGQLTGSIYSDSQGADDKLYAAIAEPLRRRVGRLLNDKMPTGVAVSIAMNHGGPYPATGHPGFTAVGIPASLHRFAQLECYDNVRQARLPLSLRDEHPGGATWRFVDGNWTQHSISPRS